MFRYDELNAPQERLTPDFQYRPEIHINEIPLRFCHKDIIPIGFIIYPGPGHVGQIHGGKKAELRKLKEAHIAIYKHVKTQAHLKKSVN